MVSSISPCRPPHSSLSESLHTATGTQIQGADLPVEDRVKIDRVKARVERRCIDARGIAVDPVGYSAIA